MLEKTMKKLLIKKVHQWLETIEDDALKAAIKKDLVITGGCFTSMIQNESPKDYDCYFKTRETVLLVANYYAKIWNESPPKNGTAPKRVEVKEDENGRIKLFIKSAGVVGDASQANGAEELGVPSLEDIEEITEEVADAIEQEETKEYFPVFMSSNAITLSNEIQIITRFFGDPSTIHDTFDFEHTKAYWTYQEARVVIPASVYECVANKTLVYSGSKYPVCSLFRLRKFIARGWTINAGQILKICMQVPNLDLNDIATLEDQLVGVDSLYFMGLIRQLQEKKQKDASFQLTSNYIISIIDKIF